MQGGLGSSEAAPSLRPGQVSSVEPTAAEWRRRLSVKVEPAEGDGGHDSVDTKEGLKRLLLADSGKDAASRSKRASGRSHKSSKKPKKSKRRTVEEEGDDLSGTSGRKDVWSKVPKAERVLEPKETPVYKAAVNPSEMPLGYSKLLKKSQETDITPPGGTANSDEQVRLMELSTEGFKGLWRWHSKNGIAYRKGPFTSSEKLLIEEALQQYAEKEGFSSVEEAFKNTASIGKLGFVRLQQIAKCLPERPLVSIYGYIRRRFAYKSRTGAWTPEEVKQLIQLNETVSRNLRGRWVRIAAALGRNPAEVRDKWRAIQPRLEAARLSGCMQQPENEKLDGDDQNNNDTSLLSCPDPLEGAPCGPLTDEEKTRLLEEVQKHTGERLPACGIPWQQIQLSAFPEHHHAQLRQTYLHSIVPSELRLRMGRRPRGVVLRHLLRALQKLQHYDLLASGLRGVQWLQLLPFVPTALQLHILKASIRYHVPNKNLSVEEAVLQLMEKMEDALLAKRESDARLLLRGVLPVETQRSIAAAVQAKAVQKGWGDTKIKRRIRRKILNAAKCELERLKVRNSLVMDAPLNAPRKTCNKSFSSDSTHERNIIFGGEREADTTAGLALPTVVAKLPLKLEQ